MKTRRIRKNLSGIEKNLFRSWHAQHFCKVRYRLCGRRSTFARSGTDFAASAALSQGTAQISRQAQHFRKARRRFRGRRSTFARSGTDFVAGAALSQGQVPISRQAQHFCMVACRFCGRRTLSQGQVQISWQGQHFRKVRHRLCGRRSTFASHEDAHEGHEDRMPMKAKASSFKSKC